MRAFRGSSLVGAVVAVGLCSLLLALPAGASGAPSCKFKPSLLDGPLQASFVKTPKQTSRSQNKRIAGSLVSLTRYECLYKGRKGKSQVAVFVSLESPFTLAEAQAEQKGTIQLGKNFAEEGAIGEAYPPLAADYAALYRRPTSPSERQTELYGYAFKNGAEVIVSMTLPNTSHAVSTAGGVLKLAVAHIHP
jgi:hypothetical protein